MMVEMSWELTSYCPSCSNLRAQSHRPNLFSQCHCSNHLCRGFWQLAWLMTWAEDGLTSYYWLLLPCQCWGILRDLVAWSFRACRSSCSALCSDFLFPHLIPSTSFALCVLCSAGCVVTVEQRVGKEDRAKTGDRTGFVCRDGAVLRQAQTGRLITCRWWRNASSHWSQSAMESEAVCVPGYISINRVFR